MKESLKAFGKLHEALLGSDLVDGLCNQISLSFRVLLHHFRKCVRKPDVWARAKRRYKGDLSLEPVEAILQSIVLPPEDEEEEGDEEEEEPRAPVQVPVVQEPYVQVPVVQEPYVQVPVVQELLVNDDEVPDGGLPALQANSPNLAIWEVGQATEPQVPTQTLSCS